MKRAKTSKDANKSLPSAALYGIPEISSTGKRQEVQGRPGEATGMNSALGQSVSGGGGGNPNSNGTSTGTSAATAGAGSCGKSKEEKPGKSHSSRGAKRDKDAARSRKDKHDLLQNGGGGQAPSGGHLYGFGAKSNGSGASPFHCGGAGSGSVGAAGEVSKTAPDSTLMGNSMLVKKEEEEEESHRRIKKLKTEKVGYDRLLVCPHSVCICLGLWDVPGGVSHFLVLSGSL